MPSLYKRRSTKHRSRSLPRSHRTDESMPPLSKHNVSINQKKKNGQKKMQAEKKAIKAVRQTVLDGICKIIVTA